MTKVNLELLHDLLITS